MTANEQQIQQASDLLRAGKLVAFPTETVYGLGADATNDQAVAAVYEAKGRPSFNPLITHVASLEAARQLGRFNPDASTLAGAFWPGPLTLVVPRAERCAVSMLASAGLATVAIRIPAHPLAEALLRHVGRPLVAPSANTSGRISPTLASHVRADLGGRSQPFSMAALVRWASNRPSSPASTTSPGYCGQGASSEMTSKPGCKDRSRKRRTSRTHHCRRAGSPATMHRAPASF